uniref:Sugar phosphate transporter domain-containing protein n=1 Tax=Arcella intermedia TaxID=1963864 RepID=A0A6B2LFG2_9EUKA
MSNNLIFYNSVVFGVAEMRVLYNFRIFTSGLLTQWVFGRPLGYRKWLAIVILFVGCVVCQWKSIGEYSMIVPFLLMFLQCFTSSLGGVSNDYLMKKDRETSIHVQNFYLYLFNFITNSIASVHSGKVADLTRLFGGYTGMTFVVIIMFTLVGLSTSWFLKNLSAMLKEFASAAEMITIAILSTLLFSTSTQISWELFLSIFLVCSAGYIYNTEPQQKSPPDIEEGKKLDK